MNIIQTIFLVFGMFLYSIPLIGQDGKQRKAFQMADSLTKKGIESYNNGEIKKALAFYYQSLKIAESVNYQEGIAKNYNNIGLIQESQKFYKEALSSYEKALKGNTIIKDTNGIAISLSNIGVVYQELGENQKAIEYFTRCLYLDSSMHNYKGVGSDYINIAINYSILEEYGNALTYYKKALNVCQFSEDKQVELYALFNISALYGNLNEYDKAIQYSEKALKLEEAFNVVQMNGFRLNLSNFYAQKGDYKKALEFFREYVEIKDSVYNQSNTQDIAKQKAAYAYEKKILEDSLKQQKILAKKDLLFQKEKSSNRLRLILISTSLLLILLAGISFYYIKKSKTDRSILLLKNQALRLQINPHFFFNAMNSISKYIGDNDAIIAKSYLSKFSKVMRLSLESVQEDVISLAQEIEFLVNYIEIEKLQHKNFDYAIIVDETMDTEEIIIPPVLIQPYIENAILHGFVNKSSDNKGFLEVSFTRKDLMLSIQIKDDGVGYKATQAKNKTHKSLALTITQKRLNAFAKKEVQVLFTSLNNESGTTIEFNIPMVLVS